MKSYLDVAVLVGKAVAEMVATLFSIVDVSVDDYRSEIIDSDLSGEMALHH